MFRLLQENLCNNAVNPFIAEDRKAMLLKLIGCISEAVQSSEHGIILCDRVGKIRQKSNLPYGQCLTRQKWPASGSSRNHSISITQVSVITYGTQNKVQCINVPVNTRDVRLFLRNSECLWQNQFFLTTIAQSQFLTRKFIWLLQLLNTNFWLFLALMAALLVSLGIVRWLCHGYWAFPMLMSGLYGQSYRMQLYSKVLFDKMTRNWYSPVFPLLKCVMC